MPSFNRPSLAAEFSVVADVFPPSLPVFSASTVAILALICLIRIFFPCVTINALDREIKALEDFLCEAEVDWLPAESVHRHSLSELEENVSDLKCEGYELRGMDWNIQRMIFSVWIQPKRVIGHYAILEKISLRAMADVEREKQARIEFQIARARRHEIRRRTRVVVAMGSTGT
ncbi:hypothetical protein Moror_7900 [Moniliophthora roreri MCA 2997]|uniref:Uncharacterized protein n=2 Tax=Moniliophthora roreri TaxID=221103 RepID=V2XC04_MONRO|nr:hypothetical protein Moror_7900 [Moniliophthora roreri MCA 2997]KAI3608894.1 hypothetical protein WG66_010909 [Moniliophthora roreri]